MIGLLAALALFGQDPDRWSEARVAPIFGEGKLGGCSINFQSVQRDHLYFGGRMVGADGSFNLYNFGEGGFGAMLKVAVLEGEALRLPDTAFLISGYATNADDVLSNMVGDDAGYRLTALQLGPSTSEAIFHIARNEVMIVGVQMNGGRSAIPFQIDISEEQRAEWRGCVNQVLDDILSTRDAPPGPHTPSTSP